jgi:hypothetical protein
MGNKKKGVDIDMNALAARTGKDIKDMAAVLASFPAPDKWTPEQKNQAVQFAALLDTAQKMIAAVGIAGIDYQTEKETFLANAGKTDSKYTRTAYGAALSRLEKWAAREEINILELSPASADNFIPSGAGPPLPSALTQRPVLHSLHGWNAATQE